MTGKTLVKWLKHIQYIQYRHKTENKVEIIQLNNDMKREMYKKKE